MSEQPRGRGKARGRAGRESQDGAGQPPRRPGEQAQPGPSGPSGPGPSGPGPLGPRPQPPSAWGPPAVAPPVRAGAPTPTVQAGRASHRTTPSTHEHPGDVDLQRRMQKVDIAGEAAAGGDAGAVSGRGSRRGGGRVLPENMTVLRTRPEQVQSKKDNQAKIKSSKIIKQKKNLSMKGIIIHDSPPIIQSKKDPRAADIAVTWLSAPLFISDTISTLFLPPQNQYIPDYTSVKIVSWGFESEQGPQMELLKTINLLKIPLVDCQERYSDVDDVAITDPVICAGDQGAKGMCVGDSGAPMVIGQVVVGLSSYFKGCGDPTHPDVFTRIDRYTNWILEAATAPGAKTSAVRVSPIV